MLKFILIAALCASAVYPADSASRWFTSSYYDLRMALKRYSQCLGDLAPLKDQFNDTSYLIHSMRTFIDQGNYDNEQLSNVTLLMDNICRADQNASYPISLEIDVDKYNSTEHPNSAKSARCRAIDQVMDAMYTVFRRASLNRSEPLDFSSIQFYETNNKTQVGYYNLTDLINTVWIASDTTVDLTCQIVGALRNYSVELIEKSKPDSRSQQQHPSTLTALLDLIDRILDPILGVQRRLYWESNNAFESAYLGLGNQLGNLRNALGNGLRATRSRIMGTRSNSTNLVNSTMVNSTSASSVNSTSSSPITINLPSSSGTTVTTISSSTTSTPIIPASPTVATARR